MFEPIWEPGDEALRPTQKPWKCPHCGTEIYTRDLIEGHKEQCQKEREERSRMLQKFRLERMKKKIHEKVKLEHDLRKKMRR